MKKVGAFVAKTKLSQLLDQAAHGASFAITKHGQVVALLIPAEQRSQLSVSEVISGIIHLRKKIAKQGVKLTLQEVNALKIQGRR